MNYIELINKFWRCDMEHPLTASDTRLYFYLLHTCNQLGWKMPFGHSDRHLAASTGLSVPTVRQCKKRLQQQGLMMFTVPKIKSKAFEGQSQYSFPTVQNNCTDTYTVPYTDPFTDGYTDPLTNNKLNKTKQEYSNNPLYPLLEKTDFLSSEVKNERSLKKHLDDRLPNTAKPEKRRKVAPKEEKGLSLPFTSKQFLECWQMLLQMPKWKNKQPQSLMLVLKKLAGYEESFAIHLVELAITNNWQGIVFPDTDAKYTQWKQNKSQHGNQTINEQSGTAKNTTHEVIQSQRDYKERF